MSVASGVVGGVTVELLGDTSPDLEQEKLKITNSSKIILFFKANGIFIFKSFGWLFMLKKFTLNIS